MTGRETEVLGENLAQCHSGHHRSHISLASNLGHHGGKPATNLLSYGTSSSFFYYDVADVE
jgi:hypothetical protein